ncbi:10216_t:CDS:2, partial [Gigaspora rosea]
MTKKIVLYLIDKSQLNYNNSKMPKISKRKAHIRKAIQASVDAQKVACHNKQIHEINQILTQMDNSELQLAYQIIVQSNSQRIVQSNSQSIIQSDSQSIVQSNSQSSNNQSIVQSNSQRIVQSNSQSIVRSNSQSIVQSTSQSTNNRLMLRQKLINIHISKVRAAARKLQLVDSRSLNASIQAIIMKNKRHYTTQFINMATQVSQIGQMSFRNTVQATQLILVVRWNQEISEIHINQILNKNNCSTFFTLGIVVDESTRGQQKIFVLCIIFWNSKTNLPDFQLLEMKDLASCTGKSVAQAIYDTFSHFKINFHQCFVCVSDNTNYMSGKS